MEERGRSGGTRTQFRGLILFAILFGPGLGGEHTIILLVVGELFGVRVLGRMMGIILTADGVAEAVTPMVVAKIRDATGSYDVGFALLIVLSFVGLLAISFLPRKGQQETTAQLPTR